jgi:flavin-dependent dehydrogenase
VGSNPTLSAIFVITFKNMMKKVDVLIIGGGPAGATLGNYLHSKNIDYLIIERGSKNRDKLCAGGLPLAINSVLPQNKLDYKKVIYDTITLNYKNRLIKSSTLKIPFMYGVMRREFDAYLREGLNVNYEESVYSFSKDKKSIIVHTDKATYITRFLIGADGVGSIVSRLSGLAPKKRFIVAEEAEIPKSNVNNMHSFSDNTVKIYLGFNFLGYGWVFPKGNVYSAGSGALKKYFKSGTTQKFIHYDKIKIYPISIWGGEEVLTDGNIAVIGEAANLVDPFSAGGIYPSVLSAKIISEVISDAIKRGVNDLSVFNEKVAHAIYSEFSYALFLSKVFYPFLPIVKNS